MDIITEAVDFVQTVFSGDSGGHDFHHTMRVFRLASRIAAEEQADLEIVQLAALLHDVDDRKVSPGTSGNKLRAAEFLRSHGVDESRAGKILQVISEISFSENTVPPSSVEGKCVQDADRLDAMGAIGVARAFAYGGSKGRMMHDPEGEDGSTTICHFYDKLLVLKDLMNTAAGRRLARERHIYLREFLCRFHAEWQGEI